MYYSVLIETTEKEDKSNKNKEYFEFDKTDLEVIKKKIVEPYLNRKNFRFDGYDMGKKEISRIKIKRTNDTTSKIAENETRRGQAMNELRIGSYTSKNIFFLDKYAMDITDIVIDEVVASISSLQNNEGQKQMSQIIDKSKIFIVHGRDDLAKTEVARFVEKIGLEAIILSEQANGGKTIIEKIEAHTDVGYGIVLYTPCDEGNLIGEATKPRARQNVVFEHGYLIGKLERKNVCALVKGDIEKPNDISGVVYITLDEHEGWHKKLVKELREAGYKIDANKII